MEWREGGLANLGADVNSRAGMFMPQVNHINLHNTLLQQGWLGDWAAGHDLLLCLVWLVKNSINYNNYMW